MTLPSTATSVRTYSFQVVSLAVLISILNVVEANTLERESTGDKLPKQTMSLESMPSQDDPLAKLRAAKLLPRRKTRSLFENGKYISNFGTLNISAIDTKILDLKSILEMARYNTNRGGFQTKTKTELPNENSISGSQGYSKDLFQFKDTTDSPNFAGSQAHTTKGLLNANSVSDTQGRGKDWLQINDNTGFPNSKTNSTVDKKEIPNPRKAVTVEEPNLIVLNQSLSRLVNDVKNAKNIFQLNDLFSKTEDIDEELKHLYRGFKIPSKSKQYRTYKRSIYSLLQEIKTTIVSVLENGIKEASSKVDLKVNSQTIHDLQTTSKSLLNEIKKGVTLKKMIDIENQIRVIVDQLNRSPRM